jgi:hypothetical protein
MHRRAAPAIDFGRGGAVSICIFLGPTLPLAEARAILDAEYLPPAAHGDVYRAARRDPKPRAIGLIDGYFRHRPAVRHKEILWALSEGIPVFGAASIGALRAAELAAFGMVGIGRIFEDFRDGRLEDDDEVAVDHGPAELGYPAINVAMVDIRATLAAARDGGVLDPASAARIVARTKSLFYPDRTYAAVAEIMRAIPHSGDEARRFEAWLKHGTVAQKRDDAACMLREMRDLTRRGPIFCDVALHQTEFWLADIRHAVQTGVRKPDGE